MIVHILTDNRTYKRGMRAEHGLSLLIEHEGSKVLFDAGQSDVWVRNAAAMGLPLSDAAFMVLSHGHYDHAGGLVHAPFQGRGMPLYVHADAFARKRALNADRRTYRDIGIPDAPEILEQSGFHIIRTTDRTCPAPGMTLLANIPYVHAFEHHPVGFHIETEHGMAADHMRDEQILVVHTRQGLVVIAGCSHPGIINCLTHVARQFPDTPFDSVIAGMHLGSTGAQRLNETCHRFSEMGIRRLIPLHCTGSDAICAMARRLPDACRPLCAGDSLDLDL